MRDAAVDDVRLGGAALERPQRRLDLRQHPAVDHARRDQPLGVGALACAILVANNLRDIPTDVQAGKHTLAVRLGDQQTRYLFVFLVAVAGVFLIGVALETWAGALLGAAYLVTAVPASRVVLGPATGPSLIPVLQKVGAAELLYAAGLFLGIAWA